MKTGLKVEKSKTTGDERQIKVSVVVPVYNASPFLGQCLDSILEQTLQEIEIICVDDGSTDDSPNILKEYSDRDGRITLVRQQNLYAGAARNRGMRMASGKFIIFWDADDFFEPDCLKEMYNKAEKTEADIVICECIAYDNEEQQDVDCYMSINDHYLPNKNIFSREDMPDDIFQTFTGCLWDKLFRLDFVKRNYLKFQDIRTAEDIPFAYMALALADRITTVRKNYIHYRKYVENSLESTKKDSWNSTLLAYDAVYKDLKKRGLLEQLQRSIDRSAVQRILRVLLTLYDETAYEEMYKKLKNETLIKFDWANHNKEYYKNDAVYDRLHRLIGSFTAKEYFMKEWKALQKERDYRIGIKNRMKDILEQKTWLFPYELIPREAKLVLYGAGDVGQDFYKQLQLTNYCSVAAWMDRRAEECRKEGLPVEAVDMLPEYDYDYIIIAVSDKGVAENIRKDLIERGIFQEKIIWYDYNKGGRR